MSRYYDHEQDRSHELAGAIYALIYFFWSALILVGLWTLYVQRNTRAVKIRGWRLIALGEIAIHAFITTIWAVVWSGPRFDCSAVFWVVSLILPLCVAVFQVTNARLVSHYHENRTYAISDTWREVSCGIPACCGLLRAWRSSGMAKKTYIIIGIGVCLQVGGTFLIYFGSRRFHGRYGLWGIGPLSDRECRFGWEWYVSLTVTRSQR